MRWKPRGAMTKADIYARLRNSTVSMETADCAAVIMDGWPDKQCQIVFCYVDGMSKAQIAIDFSCDEKYIRNVIKKLLL